MSSPRLNIIGAGKVGKSLARMWNIHGVFAIGDILNRSPGSASQAAEAIGAGRAVASLGQMQPADAWLLAVADDSIEACCHSLARSGLLTPGALVFHCSGALSSEVLGAAKNEGAATASVHPIRSFVAAEKADNIDSIDSTVTTGNVGTIDKAGALEGTWCGIEGDDAAVASLSHAFEALGARMVAIRSDAKLIYHSAAVFACNYLVTLMDVAVQAYGKSGVPPDVALQLLEPLVRGTVDNVFRLGPASALTGPIARGDLATARRQQHEVAEWNEDMGQLYQQFMKLTMELAVKRNKGK
jgi:predicted short-subunit dehydrogenase-like oxidoreductase (DUF2520 family)